MTTGEFSAITGISAYTLRYYEKKGLIRVNRDRKSVVKEREKWDGYLRNLDEKIFFPCGALSGYGNVYQS